jgi:alkylated DNA repair dioxygenase AlkB
MEITKLPLEKAAVEYHPIFLSKEEANELLDYCTGNLLFTDHQDQLYGKSILQPRKSCVVSSVFMSTFIDKIKTILPENHSRPDLIICNLYESGDQHHSQHSDSVHLEPETFTCIISLGAVRSLVFCRKNILAIEYQIELTHGSLIIMGKETQTYYTHGIPIDRNVRQPHIDLIFHVSKKL